MKQPDIVMGYEKVGQDLANVLPVLVEAGMIRVRPAQGLFEGEGYWLTIVDDDGIPGDSLAISGKSYEFLKKEIERYS